MHLKRLEIFGFKSFGNKVNVDFHEGVTAVVGPNGCGKSNISDSIKWVLGEQSAKSLRGHRMEDIIFNGASAKEPVNFAEVSLILTNEDRKLPIDFDEVMITRRLYRSGESEYMINKSIVRLKDLQSILAGTGLGVGNYSVIEQGRIDQILNARPEERRTLFEEAAGITRYKAKKKEALRNLEATEQNLSRVTDIASELKRQINSLERQAKKAEKYKREYGLLKVYDIQKAQADKLGKETLSQELSKSWEESKGKSEGASSEIRELSLRLVSERDELQKISQEYADIRSRHLILENQLKNNQEKILIFEKYVEEIDQKSEELDLVLEQATERLRKLNVDMDAFALKAKTVEHEKSQGQDQLNQAEAHYAQFEEESQAFKAKINESDEQLVILESRLKELQPELIRVQGSLQAVEEKRLSANEILVNNQEEANLKVETIQGLEAEIESLSSTIRQKVHERESLESELKHQEEDKINIETNHQSTLQEMAGYESKIAMMEDLVSKHEGFSMAARFLLDEAQREPSLSGVKGALADLIEVDRGYELALEVALGPWAQGIVCETPEDVLSASLRLKDFNKGKAVLLQLDAASQDEKTLFGGFDAGVQVLTSVIRGSESVRALANQLLRNVYVVDNASTAMSLSRKLSNSKFVTREGEMFEHCVAIAGSVNPEEETLIFGRKEKLKEYEGKLVDLKLEKERLSFKLDEATSKVKAFQHNIQVIAQVIPEMQVSLADIQSKRRHLKDASQELLDGLKQAQEETAKCLGEYEELSLKEKNIHEEIVTSQNAVNGLRQSRVNDEEAMNLHLAKRDGLLVEITQQRSSWETVLQRYEEAQKQVRQAENALVEETDLNGRREQEKVDLAQKRQQTESDLVQLKENSQSHSEERQLLLDQHNSIAQVKNSKSESVDQMQSQKDSLQEALNALLNHSHEVELKVQSCQHDLELIHENIMINYHFDLKQDTLLQDMLDQYNEKPLDNKSSEVIREKLSKVGNVNLIAVEEYGDLQERYEFLEHEREDLLKAKDDMHKALLKINRTTREMFVETFTQIQTYFTEYYKLLFRGGNAEIVLLDEGDVLESGIEIVARPPGKKLQAITLLSGGEKALTAIALMFAVFRVKPSPFCVLDEIDAPLDDANVQRFTNVLHEFLKQSQFILITHNKNTMAMADALYGVTMQSSGVSKVVSVKFSDDRSEPALPADRPAIAEAANS